MENRIDHIEFEPFEFGKGYGKRMSFKSKEQFAAFLKCNRYDGRSCVYTYSDSSDRWTEATTLERYRF